MREPDFWWRAPGLAAMLASPLGTVYGRIAAARLRRPGRTLPVPVVCVGNLTLGGAGKTPTAIAIARLLQGAGLKPIFLTRGYKGRLKGPLTVTPGAAAADVGDEPLLLARTAPTILARDRVAGAQAALAAGARVIVMDDGLQNPSLAKSLALVVLDGRRGIGNGCVFPAGPLRLGLEAQLDVAHALLVIGPPSDLALSVLDATRRRGLPVFSGRVLPDPAAVAALRGKRLLAYAGIADPGKFFATLANAGLAPVRTAHFADHHAFTETEAARLIADAAADGLTLVTTEKDFLRLQGDPALAALAAASATLPVGLVIDDTAGLRAVLAARTGLRL
ncbi:tetraacyldisaccharide 4'-kinase [Rhodoplanes elegans]|uniref:Tetraacyldisaccharide 4'-kinase n=2 Tax=Rhodoplanes elegans TaxID=29408 RepID=A0A327JW48_9BRAD|nr:tetraacyldisaccharide 4'-kinase [Rhodoplanes elegans]RAI30447.1 tetraacyldisaccharide 4'-kinase [Rhodoplanes elegans]